MRNNHTTSQPGTKFVRAFFVYKEECRSVFVGFPNRHEKAVFRRVVRSGGGRSSGETSSALFCFQ